MFGLADAVPAHAEILPVTSPGVITAVVGVGLTVIEKLIGVPLQVAPPDTKFPKGAGPVPTGTVVSIALVAAFITDTEFEALLVTYTLVPSGLTDTPTGPAPTDIVFFTANVFVSITVTLFEPRFVT